MNGGEWIAEVLVQHGVRFLFTLCGGHISPILVGCKHKGIRVIDVRDEKNAVFAADATSRLTGIPGVAAVTAGPGVTNTITAIKNAQLAQSPLILLGGATAGVLKGRGALQDIDQLAVVRPHVKSAVSVKRVRDLPGAVNDAFAIAQEGVPDRYSSNARSISCTTRASCANGSRRAHRPGRSSRCPTARSRGTSTVMSSDCSRVQSASSCRPSRPSSLPRFGRGHTDSGEPGEESSAAAASDRQPGFARRSFRSATRRGRESPRRPRLSERHGARSPRPFKSPADPQ